MSNRISQLSHRRGIAHIWTAIFLLVFVGFLGLATDTAWVVLVKQQLHNAADASALAGAAKVRADQDEARDAAVNLAAVNAAASDSIVLDRNDANDAGGDVVLGHYDRDDRTFTPTTSGPNAVKVVARRIDANNNALPLIFGPIFGTDDANVTATSIAMVGGGTGSGMIVLDPDASCALSVGGNATLNVNNGAIQVNSTSSTGACTNGNPSILAPEVNIVGGSSTGFEGDYDGDINEGAPVIPDPLAALEEPPTGSPQPKPPKTSPATIQPGWYKDGIERTNGGGLLTMQPGIYYIDNASVGFSVTGGQIVAHEVMIYMKRGVLDWRGGATYDVTPPTSGDYEHVSIFQARTNTAEAEINGGSNMSILGTMYFPNNTLDLRGNGDGFNIQQLIANQVTISGDGTFTINYDGAFPAPGNTVFLVE